MVCLPIPAPSWRLDDNPIVLPDSEAIFAANVLSDSPSCDERVPARLSALAALQSVWAVNPSLTQHAYLHLLHEHELTNGSVASLVFARTPRACPLSKLQKYNRIVPLEMLDIGNAGVGHVTLCGGAVVPVTSAAAPTDCLVVAELVTAEEEVVHSALAARHSVEGLQNEVNQFLGGLNITADDCGCWRRGEDRVLRNNQSDRPETARVQRDLLAQQGSDTVQDSTSRDGFGGVGVAHNFLTSASKIENCSLLLPIDSKLQFECSAVIHVLGALY